MDPVQADTAAFSACRSCGGLWFPSGQLAELLSRDGASVDSVEDKHGASGPVDEPVVFSCPACSCALDRYRYQYTSPVVLDGCPKCGGVFVQDEELNAIVRWRDRDQTQESKDAAVAEAVVGADARMVAAIRGSQAAMRASRAMNMRWGFDGGLFKWSTADVFGDEPDLPPAPGLPD